MIIIYYARVTFYEGPDCKWLINEHLCKLHSAFRGLFLSPLVAKSYRKLRADSSLHEPQIRLRSTCPMSLRNVKLFYVTVVGIAVVVVRTKPFPAL